MTKSLPEDKPTLLQSTKNKEDFKFFRTVENTIIGTLSFFWRFLTTLWLMLAHPGQLIPILDTKKQGVFYCRPFTFLTISCYFTSIYFNNQEVHGLSLFSVKDLTRDLKQISFLKAALQTLPLLMTVFIFVFIFAYFASPHSISQRRKIINLVCYATGYSYFIITLHCIDYFTCSW